MELSEALAAQLAVLTEALDEPGVDIEATLRRLAADVAAATTSFAGFSVSVHVGERPTTIIALADSVSAENVISSLRIPLSVRDGVSGDAHLVLYASRHGALVDLAADLSWLTGRPLTTLVLNGDIAGLPALLEAGDIGADRSIDQAAGVLVASGMTLDQAYAEIKRRAGLDGGDEIAVAQEILDAIDADS